MECPTLCLEISDQPWKSLAVETRRQSSPGRCLYHTVRSSSLRVSAMEQIVSESFDASSMTRALSAFMVLTDDTKNTHTVLSLGTIKQKNHHLPCHIASHSTCTPFSMSQSKVNKVVCNVRRSGLVIISSMFAVSAKCFRRWSCRSLHC